MTDTVIVTETNTVLSVIGSEPQVIVADPQVETVAVSTTDTVVAVQDATPSLAVSDQTGVVTVVQELFQTVEVVAQGPQGPPGSGSVWGSITGTLSNQTDLQNALNAKADASALAGYALVSRLISAGTGLTGGGSLAADRALAFDTAWGDARYVQPAALSVYALVSRLISAGTGLTGGGSLAADRTLSVVDDTTTQRVQVALAGTLVGTRRRLNFIQGANVTLSVVDDTVNNDVDVTIAATGGGGGGTPGGSSQQVQVNNAGAFAGFAGFTYDSVGGRLTIGNGSGFSSTVDGVRLGSADAAQQYAVRVSGGQEAYFGAWATGGYVGTRTNHPFEFYTNNLMRGSISAAGVWTFGGDVSITGASRRIIIGSANDGTATLFQGSTLNASTIFGAVPNGASTVGGIRVYGGSSGTNTTFAQIAIDGAGGFASVDSSHNAIGGFSLPLRFRMTTAGAVTTRATLFNNGNFNIGPTLTDPNVMLRVEGSVRFDPPGGKLLGLNVASSAWMSTTSGIEFARAGNAIISYNNGPAVQISSNTFFDGTSWVYANTGVAGVLNINGGTLNWLNAPSGTGGANLTLASRFSVNGNGNAVIGAPVAGNALSLFSGALFTPGANPTGAALRVQGSFGGGIVIEDTSFWGFWADGAGANLRFGSSPDIATGFTIRATLSSLGNFTTANYFATGATGFRHTDGGTGAYFELRAWDAGGGWRPTSFFVSNAGEAATRRFDFSSSGNLVAWAQSNFNGFEVIAGTSNVPAITLHKSGNYAARMYLNGNNRFSFGSFSAPEDVFMIDFGGTTFLRSTGPTHWWWDTDHRTFGIHVNSNLAYFMRGGVNDPNWTTVTDRYGTSRWPMVMDLNSGNMEMGNDLRTGGKFFGRYAGNGLAAVILSTASPSGGADGDLWLRY